MTNGHCQRALDVINWTLTGRQRILEVEKKNVRLGEEMMVVVVVVMVVVVVVMVVVVVVVVGCW